MAQHKGGQLHGLVKGPNIQTPQVRRPGPAPQVAGAGTVGPQRRNYAPRIPHQVGHHRLPMGRGGGMLGGAGSSGHIPVGNMFDTGLGNPKAAGSFRCIGRNGQECGRPLATSVEDYYLEGGEGPLCEDCWTDKRVVHNMQNNPALPPCQFGVNWGSHQDKLAGVIAETIQRFQTPQPGHQPRFPTKEELQTVLSGIKFSRDCPNCAKMFKGKQYPVTFTPEVDDFTIPGVNAPLQQG